MRKIHVKTVILKEPTQRTNAYDIKNKPYCHTSWKRLCDNEEMRKDAGLGNVRDTIVVDGDG